MAEQWYYAHQGQQAGPVSTDDLKQLAAAGQLQPGDMIWQQGMAAWAPASTVEGLFAGLPAGVPPGAPPYPMHPGAYPGAARFTLPNWSPGAWVILGSLVVLFASMFCKWTRFDTYISSMGLLNPWVMFAGAFVYPVWTVLASRPVNLIAGLLCALWGVLTAVFWILKFITPLGSLANWGLYVYLVACIVLLIGVVLDKLIPARRS